MDKGLFLIDMSNTVSTYLKQNLQFYLRPDNSTELFGYSDHIEFANNGISFSGN